MELEYKVIEEKEYDRWVLRVGIFSKQTWVFMEFDDEPTTGDIDDALHLFRRVVDIWEYFSHDSSVKLTEITDEI